MAGEIIRPKDLTPRPAPVASELMVVDNSVNVGAATIKAIVEAGRPAASQAEAQAGTDPSKAMTPLTTKQSIGAEVGVTLASKAQGDLASTAMQPDDLAPVATTGAYADLSGRPTLGTAAATDASDYATTTQGGKADTALQSVVPGENVTVDATDPLNPVVSSIGGGLLDGSVTDPKLADALALSLGKICYTRAELKALDTSRHKVAYLAEPGREGVFVWDGSDLSGVMVVKSKTVSSVDATANTFRMREVMTSTFSAATNTFTSAGHGFTALQQVIIPVTRNAMQGGGLFYIGSDVTTNTFRLYTSIGTATAAGTPGLVQIGVVSTSVSGNTISKNNHRWKEGTIVRPTAAVNGLSTSTDYYIKFINVNGVQLSLTLGGAAVTLTGTAQVTLYQPGNMTVREPHDMFTGQAFAVDSAVDGMLANTPYNFIATDQCYGKVASSFANAKEGTAFDLSAGTAFTFRHLLDPKQARYVVSSGDRITGEDGAWKRIEADVKAAHWDIVADGGATDNSETVQCAIWFAVYSGKRKVFFDAYTDKIGLKYEVGHYTHTNISVGGVVNPRNGVVLVGASIDDTRFCRTGDSTNASYLFVFDGNFWGVSHVVGSNPMGQGPSEVHGMSFVGPGQTGGGTISGFGWRGVYGLKMSQVTIQQFPFHGINVFSGVDVTSGIADDDVDGSNFMEISGLSCIDNGRAGINSSQVRLAVVSLDTCTMLGNLWSGLNGCFINAGFKNCNVSHNGSRAVTSSGGYNFFTSSSGAVCRLLKIEGGITEANFWHEMAFNAVKSLTIRDVGFNLYAPSDAAINGLPTDQGAIRIKANCESWEVTNCKFTANTTAYGDIWCIDVASGSHHGRINIPNFAGLTSHLRLQSAVDVVISGHNETLSYTKTGSAPSGCFQNFTALT